MATVVIPNSDGAPLADYLDLRTAVIETVGNADIADIFPRLVKMAEVQFNRKLRCRQQMGTANIVTVNEAAALPADYLETISLTYTNGQELNQQPIQAYNKLYDKRGFYAIQDGNIVAQDANYTLDYYARIPTIGDTMTSTNWLLEKHPGLYLYGVSLEAEKHLRNLEGVQQMIFLRDQELQAVYDQDDDERYSRTRVRVAGPTP